jgi:pyrimidine-nucleoside phosphorylase/thymidine phosphorylase
VSGIDAELIGQASSLIGAGRKTTDDAIDPAVGVILEVKVGQKIDPGSILCRIYYTSEEHLEEASELVEDAFKIAQTPVEERELILEVVS